MYLGEEQYWILEVIAVVLYRIDLEGEGGRERESEFGEKKKGIQNDVQIVY